MTNSTKDLAAEIERMDERRATLAGDLEHARAALDVSREGLLSGKANAAEVTKAQSAYSALSEALAVLDTRITERRAQLEEAIEEEQRTAAVARLSLIQQEREALNDELQSLYEKGNQALAGIVAEYIKKMQERGALAGEASTIRSRMGTTDSSQTRYSASEQFRPRPVEFGEAIETAIWTEINRLERMRSKEMSRQRVERERALHA
jgi:predicted  nucleic acid-binding Zn-ribbon protein